MTGGVSGIGIETVRALTTAGGARINGSTDFEWKTPAQGAATSVLLAASPLLEGVGGRYFEDCNEAEPNLPGSRRGVAHFRGFRISSRVR